MCSVEASVSSPDRVQISPSAHLHVDKLKGATSVGRRIEASERVAKRAGCAWRLAFLKGVVKCAQPKRNSEQLA